MSKEPPAGKTGAPVKIVEQDEPLPVEIVGETAAAAAIHDPSATTQTSTTYTPPFTTVARSEGLVATPTTTEEEDLHTRGQRKVNLIWEVTQAIIAISITAAVIYTSLRGIESQILGNAFILVISMYLVRTNHTKIGGVGGTDSR